MSINLFLNNLIEGDRASLTTFVNENRNAVYRTCLAYVQNSNDAEDITQEVFIKALEKLNQYKGEAKLSTWLIRIAINLSLNFLRDNKKRLLNTEINETIYITDEKDYIVTKETKKMVRKAIFKLPEKQRKVFILSFYLDLSYKEIAEITGYSISSIESLLFRARKKIRDLLTIFYSSKKK